MINIAVTNKAAAEAPKPLEFKGETGRYYETIRNGRKHRLWLVGVKKDHAIVKDDPEDKHSSDMSLAKFMKFYV